MTLLARVGGRAGSRAIAIAVLMLALTVAAAMATFHQQRRELRREKLSSLAYIVLARPAGADAGATFFFSLPREPQESDGAPVVHAALEMAS